MTIAAPGKAGRPASSRARAVVLLAGMALVLVLSSCTGVTAQSQQTSGSADGGGVIPATTPASPTSSVESPGGGEVPTAQADRGPATPSATSADDSSAQGVAVIAASVEAALRVVAEEQDEVNRDQVRAAIERGFSDAGAQPELLEVSIDRTPTGLEVDSIQGSGLLAGDCIIGEVRDGTVSVVVLPVLATGFCFVGDQR